MPTGQIFVSHSRTDAEGRLFLSDFFNGNQSLAGNLHPFFYSLRSPRPPHADKIREHIRESEALLVLLSEQMLEHEYTHSWICFEVGVAAALDLPVVVVDPQEHPVELPIPGATVLLFRPNRFEGALDPSWAALLEKRCRLEPSEPLSGAEGFWGNLFQFVGNAISSDNDSTGHFRLGTCQYDNCRHRFYVPSTTHWTNAYPCPSCREGVRSLLVQLQTAAEAATRASQSVSERAVPALPPVLRPALGSGKASLSPAKSSRRANAARR